ncbi:MAG: CDP-diacylglycerol--glycerol-3-phosphate 3-phosphatidyltransferase [Spirochaetia bacterium]|nr:CDP-diacylglycerol--glycerol-3-phosphate 3-phosphatidyltransferase [Spirochaetia bacterium]
MENNLNGTEAKQTGKFKRVIDENMRKLPNRITMFRIGLVFVFIPCLLSEKLTLNYIAIGLFALASISDWLDGYIARKYQVISVFGQVMDPLADKILVISTLVCFTWLQLVPAWMVTIVLGREFLISGMRILAAEEGYIIKASNWGKAKTATEMTAITTILLLRIVLQTLEYFSPDSWEKILTDCYGATGDILIDIIRVGPWVLMFIATCFSLISGLEYVFRNKQLFDKGI